MDTTHFIIAMAAVSVTLGLVRIIQLLTRIERHLDDES